MGTFLWIYAHVSGLYRNHDSECTSRRLPRGGSLSHVYCIHRFLARRHLKNDQLKHDHRRGSEDLHELIERHAVELETKIVEGDESAERDRYRQHLQSSEEDMEDTRHRLTLFTFERDVKDDVLIRRGDRPLLPVKVPSMVYVSTKSICRIKGENRLEHDISGTISCFSCI